MTEAPRRIGVTRRPVWQAWRVIQYLVAGDSSFYIGFLFWLVAGWYAVTGYWGERALHRWHPAAEYAFLLLPAVWTATWAINVLARMRRGMNSPWRPLVISEEATTASVWVWAERCRFLSDAWSAADDRWGRVVRARFAWIQARLLATHDQNRELPEDEIARVWQRQPRFWLGWSGLAIGVALLTLWSAPIAEWMADVIAGYPDKTVYAQKAEVCPAVPTDRGCVNLTIEPTAGGHLHIYGNVFHSAGFIRLTYATSPRTNRSVRLVGRDRTCALGPDGGVEHAATLVGRTVEVPFALQGSDVWRVDLSVELATWSLRPQNARLLEEGSITLTLAR